MAERLRLLREGLTLEKALASNDDMLLELTYPEKQEDFYSRLLMHKSEIEALVCYHLGMKKTQSCRIGNVEEWMRGNYNVCIPIYVDEWVDRPRKKRVIIRIPFPYKVGESENPGNVEEKLRCEAATFIWIKDNCPTVPIPYLWGFGFPDGQCFTTAEAVTQPTWLLWYLWRTTRKIFGHSVPCSYISRRYETPLNIGYLIMDYVEASDGKLLSKSWTSHQRDQRRRANFLGDLSRVMLSMAQFSFPRIGSMTIDKDGFLRLTNRPLTFRIQQLENKGVPTGVGRSDTYSSVDAYFSDLLSCHDRRINYQANSIRDQSDGEKQLSVLSAMRALLPHFISRDLRHGPFIFTLMDVHPNNVFVDDDWHIKCLIDLEWACVRPIEMVLPPVWLTGRRVDELPNGSHLEAYTLILEEFFDSFSKMESLLRSKNSDSLLSTQLVRRSWDSGSFWYFHALDNPKVVQNLFFQHIQCIFMRSRDHARMAQLVNILAPLWGRYAQSTISLKLTHLEAYEKKLREFFDQQAVQQSSII